MTSRPLRPRLTARRRAVVSVATVVATLAGFAPSVAASVAAAPTAGSPTLPAPTVPAPVEGLDDRGVDRLERRATEEPVRVIVGLEEASGAVTGRAARGRVGAARSRLLDDLAGTEHAVTRTFESLPYVALELSADAVRQLRESGEVASISEDLPLRPYLTQSAPLVEAPQAWSAGATGSGGTIAVIDTGVERTHPFLSGKVVDESCFVANGGCPNGSSTQTGTGSAAPCAEANCFHGTHVAGIAAGSGTSFSGVAKGASIMALRVFRSGGEAGVQANTSDVIAALEHVYTKRSTLSVSAVNISMGTGLYGSACDTVSPGLADVVGRLRAAGIVTVAAAGNASSTTGIGFPACVSDVVSVGGTDKSDALWSQSNRASILDVLAPATSINSSRLDGTFGAVSGTSMATPHVAGAVTILKRAEPAASVDQIVAALRTTGKAIPVNGSTKPRIRIEAALDSLGSTTQPATPPALRGTPVAISSSAKTVAPALPAGVVAGDLLLASVTVDAATTVAAPSGWTLMAGWPYQNGSESYRARQYVFYRFATGPQSGSVSFVKSAAKPSSVVVTAVSGVDPANPFDALQVKVATWSTVPSPVVTTTVDGALLVGFVSARHGSGTANLSVTPPTWISERAESSMVPVVGEFASVAQAEAGTIGSGWFNVSASAGIVASVIALRPKADGGPTTTTTVPPATTTTTTTSTTSTTVAPTTTSTTVPSTTTTVPPVSSGPPALRGVPQAASSSSSSLSVGVPAGVVAGDLLLASVTVDAATTVAAPSGWTLMAGWPYQNGSESYRARQYVFYRFATGPQSGSVSFVKSAARPSSVVVTAVSGVDPANPFDALQVKVATWSTVPSPVVTTTVDGALLLGFVSARHGSGTSQPSVTPPSWITERAESSMVPVVAELASVTQSEAGTIGSGWFNLSVSSGIVASVIALRPAPTTTTPTSSEPPTTTSTTSTTVAPTTTSTTVPSTTTTVPPVSSGPPALRGVPQAASSSSSSLSVGVPAGVVAGDLLLASVTVDAATTVAAPSGWTLMAGWPYQNGSESYRARQYVFYRFATGPQSGSVSFAKSAAKPSSVVLTAVSGVDQSNPFDALQVKVSTWSTVPSPVVTTTIDGALLLGFVSARHGSGTSQPSVTPPSWITERAESSMVPVVAELASVTQSEAGTIGSGWFNLSVSSGIVASVIALTPAS